MIEAVLFYNPEAGRFPLSERRLKRLLENLYRYGLRAKAVPSSPGRRPGAALDLKDKELLIVYGGDGTVHAALKEAVFWRVPIAILPAGTVNILARELGLPADPERALPVAVRGKPQRVNLGKAGGEYFHLMAGIGPDGYIINRVDSRLKRLLGTGAYWVAGLIHFWRYPLRPFRIEIDGQSFEATFAVVGNTSNYGGRLLITPRASLFDDGLDVCLFTSTRRSRFVRYLWGAVWGNHIHYPDVIYRKAKRIRVEGDESILVQMDGEVIGSLPMEFSSFPEGVEIMVPGGLHCRPLGRGPFFPKCSIFRRWKSSLTLGLSKLTLLIFSARVSNSRQSIG